MYQPRVVDWQDPFTGTRTMLVGESNQSQILTAMASMNRPYYAPPRTIVPNTLLGMAISEGDTVLTYSQSDPIRQYNVPADGITKIRLISPHSRINQQGKSVTFTYRFFVSTTPRTVL